MDSKIVNATRRRKRGGFTVFESIVAMFILLVGLLGIVAVFGSGMQARMMSQELVISGELANMWAEWIRFRLGEGGASNRPALGRISLSELSTGRSGDFFNGQGDFGLGDDRDLPTKGKYAYHGYKWEIRDSKDYIPQWVASEDAAGDRVKNWTQRAGGSGGSILPAVMGGDPRPLREITVAIFRGARQYEFVYVFSGVAIRYE